MMDNAKAKEALMKAMMVKQASQMAQGFDPEVQAPMATMQPADGYVDPMRPMGSVMPNAYNLGNMIDGSDQPEARAVGRRLMP